MELLEILGSISPLSTGVQNYLKEHIDYRYLKKNEYLLKGGQISRRVNFVESGLLRSFIYTNDKEVTTDFFGPGKASVNLSSFETQTPSEKWVEALEDTVLITLHRDHFLYCLNTFPESKEIYKRVILNAIMEYIHQRDVLKSLKAKDKYIWFVNRYPDLAQRVPQKYIASFLGIAVWHLSRIRL